MQASTSAMSKITILMLITRSLTMSTFSQSIGFPVSAKQSIHYQCAVD